MEKVAVCFDVDGTLVDGHRKLPLTLAVLEAFLYQPWKNVDLIIWSGGGADYARTVVQRIFKHDLKRIKFHSKLEAKAIREKYDQVIAFDDIQDTRIGDVNLIVRNK